MGLKLRYFNREEAEALIPQITEIFHSALQTKERIEQKVESWRKEHKEMKPAEEAVIRGQVDYLATELEKKLAEVAELGATPKDLDQGLVDFPARIDGKEVYLCWKLGELKIEYWHGLTEGFTGRKPITGKIKNDEKH